MENFSGDETAVSPVIGFALILAIIVSTLGYMQTHFVPVWNAEAESEHFEDVFQDMALFSSNLESAALSGIPRTSSIRLGFTYPKRGIFYNPKTSLFGNMEVRPDLYVNITYTTVFNTTTKSYRSSSLKYELPGNHPSIVYEHGILIRDFSKFGRPNATGSANTLIVGDNINIPLMILNGSGFSTISVQRAGVPIYPIELTDKKNFVEYLRYVNITLDTHYPEAWRHILRFAGTAKTNISVAGSNGTGKIYINTTAGNEIDLPDETSQVAQAGRLYGGMAVVKTTATLESYKGIGQESMSYGSVWKDVPPPGEVSQIIITNITIDPNQGGAYSTKDDLIIFKVTDVFANYWFVSIYFKDGNRIDYITGRTRLGSWTNDTDISVTSETRIDLLNGVFSDSGRYQVSNISRPNSLVSTFMGDFTGADPDKSPLIYYKLIIQ